MIGFDKKHTLGILSNPKRFNVAISRAQALLVIVGNPYVLAQVHVAFLFLIKLTQIFIIFMHIYRYRSTCTVHNINNVHWIFPCWTLSMNFILSVQHGNIQWTLFIYVLKTIEVLALRMTCMNFDLQVLSQLISLVHWTGYVYIYMYTSPDTVLVIVFI